MKPSVHIASPIQYPIESFQNYLKTLIIIFNLAFIILKL